MMKTVFNKDSRCGLVLVERKCLYFLGYVNLCLNNTEKSVKRRSHGWQ